MTVVNADAKSLEVFCAAYLSQDKKLMQELWAGMDIHSLNQQAFGLPEGKEGRLIAKILIFRILYGGTEFSFAQDPLFMPVSKSEKYWRKVIERFYEKYTGIAKWHNQLMQQATTTGRIVMPTGRVYRYFMKDNKWPTTAIKNYPVQGFGADLMAIARVVFAKKFRSLKAGVLVATVHDSIVVDIPDQYLPEVAAMFHATFAEIPKEFERRFKQEFNLPLFCEVSFGPNLGDLTEYQ